MRAEPARIACFECESCEAAPQKKLAGQRGTDPVARDVVRWERSVLLLERVEGVLEPVSISESTMLGHKSTRFAPTLPRLA